MNEIVIERRHQIKIGDALAVDQAESMFDVETAQANKSSADQRHGEQRAHAHGVIKRHDTERVLAVGVKVLRHVGERGGTFGALAAGHALRLRRRPGGVEHHRPGVGGHARERVRRGLRGERGEADIGWQRRIERDARQLSRRGRTVHGLRGYVLIHEGFRPGILDKKVDLARRRAPVHRRDDDAGKLTGPVQARGLPAVGQRGDEMVAWLQPDGVEAGDQRRDGSVPLRIG